MFEYKKQKILFSGDISFHSSGILKGAVPPPGRVDTLVVETTRGSYSRPEGSTYDGEVERFTASVSRVLRDGGSVLVPAFALGRMQEILYIMLQGEESMGKIPAESPVFAGGLGLDIAEYFIRGAKRSNMFSFSKQHMEGVKPLRGEIVPGKDFDTKGIYVLGSGMMVQNTPSYLAAAAMLESRRKRRILRRLLRRRHAGAQASALRPGRLLRLPRPLLRRDGKLQGGQVRPDIARRPRGNSEIHPRQGPAQRGSHAREHGIPRMVHVRNPRPLPENARHNTRAFRNVGALTIFRGDAPKRQDPHT